MTTAVEHWIGPDVTVTLTDPKSEHLFGCTDNTLYNKLLQSDKDKKQLSLMLLSSYIANYAESKQRWTQKVLQVRLRK